MMEKPCAIRNKIAHGDKIDEADGERAVTDCGAVGDCMSRGICPGTLRFEKLLMVHCLADFGKFADYEGLRN